MTTDIERNRKADIHGKEGEQAALVWLQEQAPASRVKIINTLIDLLVDGSPVEIKTCAEFIAAPEKGGQRSGRFFMSDMQHPALVQADGYYLFVVLRENGHPTIWMSAAKDIYFRRQIAWTVAIKARKAEPALIAGAQHENKDQSTP